MLLCAAAGRAQDIASPGAVLMVHFGTTHDDTRHVTIDAINALAREAFPDRTVAEAWTSRIVMKRLAARAAASPAAAASSSVGGDLKSPQPPIDALLRLRAQSCRRVTVQPTFIIDGKEMDQLRRDVDAVRPFFDTIAVGTPLLYNVEDCQRVCDILARRHPAISPQGGSKRGASAVVFVGHGTEGPATALYSQLDYMLHAQGHPRHHVATIEGYPTLQTLIARLKADRTRHVTLVPLLFVAGDHAVNDISVDWKEALEREGMQVSLCLEGLGQVPEIQQLYIERIKD